MLIIKYTRSFALEFTAHYLHQLHTYLLIYVCPEIKQIFGKSPICHIENKEMRQIDLKMENSGNLSMKRLFRS